MPWAARLTNPFLTLLIPILAAVTLYLNPSLRTPSTNIFNPLRPRPSPIPSLTMPRAPVIALSHGGGPMPLLNDPTHKALIASLRTRVPSILRLNSTSAPRAIVLVTAHWSARNPTISSGATHELLYDYYGFPASTYNLSYPAAGSPSVALEVKAALEAEGLMPELDARRGWDHGVFVPMLLVNPAADVPIVQVSVMESEGAEEHFRMGRALGRLREGGVAVVGSGFASVHNLRVMYDGTIGTPAFLEKNRRYSEELGEALREESGEERERRLSGWRGFTGAYEMHPRDHAEHFMPLMVCAAAGGEGMVKSYKDDFMGLSVWSYYWE